MFELHLNPRTENLVHDGFNNNHHEHRHRRKGEDKPEKPDFL